jgi:glyoxylase-like metal-dependent hydrolase (beta-lactamase superfamily II)
LERVLPAISLSTVSLFAVSVPTIALPAIALLAVNAVQAQEFRTPAPVSIEPIRDNLYLLTGEGGNVAALVTDDGVVLVDNMFDRNHEGIVAAVASVTDRPIAYVLNTHQHDDHAGGDSKMLPLADVIAHENVRVNLTDIREPYYQDTPGLPIGLPNITFADRFALFVGGTEVRALHLGRGHTNGDAIVHFPDLRVIHTGDLFLGRRAPPRADRPPGVNIYVDYAQGGSFLDWTATLDAVLALDFDTIVPGHGPVSTRADLVQFRADLEAMRERIAGLIDMGASKGQILAVFESDYGWRSTGCPPSPPTPGCLQFQQMDALIEELRR